MFLIPLIHTQYSARTPITSFDNIISIPSIRGGSASPSSSSTIVCRSSNPSASPSIPTETQLVAEGKEQLTKTWWHWAVKYPQHHFLPIPALLSTLMIGWTKSKSSSDPLLPAPFLHPMHVSANNRYANKSQLHCLSFHSLSNMHYMAYHNTFIVWYICGILLTIHLDHGVDKSSCKDGSV